MECLRFKCKWCYVDDRDRVRCGYDYPSELDEPCFVEDLEECCGEFEASSTCSKELI